MIVLCYNIYNITTCNIIIMHIAHAQDITRRNVGLNSFKEILTE